MSKKIHRVMAVVEGRRPDRTPVSFWHHFDPHQRCGPAAVEAHLRLLQAYDLDFLKVMNDNGYPHPRAIRAVEDLDAFEALDGDEPEFARQLELLESLAAELRGQVLMVSTLFNAWATLRRLVKPKALAAPPRLDLEGDQGGQILSRFVAEDRARVSRALRIIGESLARFAARCLEAGADGVFLSARDDWVDVPCGAGTYGALVRPTDLRILEAARAARCNMLHVCGRAVDFAAFAEYPVQVINWADRASGPAIAGVRDALRPAICAGVDNMQELPRGTPGQVAAQVREAIAQAAARPLIIAPGCTFDPQAVPSANLHALCDAARSPAS